MSRGEQVVDLNGRSCGGPSCDRRRGDLGAACAEYDLLWSHAECRALGKDRGRIGSRWMVCYG